MWRALVAFSGSRDVADEASAEAFAQALRRGNEVRDVASWVWRSAFAIARGELQRRARDSDAAPEPDGDVPDFGGLHAQLMALSSLSDGDRELVVLCHLAGWTPHELADLQGVSAGAMRVRLHRATRHARALLNESDRSGP